MTVSAVQQAVDLLIERLGEAQRKRDELTSELSDLNAEIEGIADAVQRLTGLAAPNPVRLSPHAEERPASIRAAVKQILDSEAMPYTTSTIRHLLPSYLTDGKTAEQVSNAVRSALWSLRQSGEAIMTPGSEGTVSTKHPGFVAANDPQASSVASDLDDVL